MQRISLSDLRPDPGLADATLDRGVEAVNPSADKDFSLSGPLSSGFVPYDLAGQQRPFGGAPERPIARCRLCRNALDNERMCPIHGSELNKYTEWDLLVLSKYSPDQPRDDAGRFADGGTGGYRAATVPGLGGVPVRVKDGPRAGMTGRVIGFADAHGTPVGDGDHLIVSFEGRSGTHVGLYHPSRVTKDYNPDEARASDGKWTSGGDTAAPASSDKPRSVDRATPESSGSSSGGSGAAATGLSTSVPIGVDPSLSEAEINRRVDALLNPPKKGKGGKGKKGRKGSRGRKGGRGRGRGAGRGRGSGRSTASFQRRGLGWRHTDQPGGRGAHQSRTSGRARGSWVGPHGVPLKAEDADLLKEIDAELARRGVPSADIWKYSEDEPRDDQGRWASQGYSVQGDGDRSYVDHTAHPEGHSLRYAGVVERWTDGKYYGRQPRFSSQRPMDLTKEPPPGRPRATRDAAIQDVIDLHNAWYHGRSDKYSEDEARDDRGRWTADGAGDTTTPVAEGARAGGFSVHPYRGTAPRTGYQVAMTGRTAVHPASIVDDPAALAKAVDDLVMKNRDVLTPGGHTYIGGWIHDGQLFLEPSERIVSRSEAVKLGVSRDQISIWDNAGQQEIATGGTGAVKGVRADPRGVRGDAGGGAPEGRAGDRGRPAGATGQVLDKYSPDQPRDDAGRWTAGGGGAAGGPPADAVPVPLDGRKLADFAPEIQQAAVARVAAARAAEPAITAALAPMAAAAGGTLDAHFRGPDGQDHHTLEAATKGESSTARKIHDDMRDKIDPATGEHLTTDQAAAQIHDSIRYTATIPAGQYADGAKAMMDQMQQAGFTPLRGRDFWNGATEGYAGINTVWQAPDGHEFELQFHTPEALQYKEGVGHPVYAAWQAQPWGTAAKDYYNSQIVSSWAPIRASVPYLDHIADYMKQTFPRS